MTSRGSHRSCRTETTIYCDRKHIYDKSKLLIRKLLGSLAQFCAAFYHVPSSYGKLHFCLDESRCKIGERMDSSASRKKAHPRTVVALIKCQDKDDSVTYEARYTNCYDDKMHAEDYFRLDVENGALSELIAENKVSIITMFITFQPCHMTVRSTQGTREDHTCSETLLTLFRDQQFSGVRNDIEVCIKPTHLYKLIQTGSSEPDEMKHAAEGIKMLIKDGIDVVSMDGSDWEYLFAMVESNHSSLPVYQGSSREALDNEIREILHDLEIETALEYPLTHKCDTEAGIYKDSKHIYKRQNSNHGKILGSVAQLCASFYHIYEGKMAHSSHHFYCLDNRDCFTSKKTQKLRGFYDPPKTMVLVVKCEGVTRVMYEARYTDCYGLGLFAEEFFVQDARRGELGNLISHDCIRRITMFVTWPPRRNPKLDTRDNCMAFAQLNLDLLLPRRIEFRVKLAHMCKEGRPKYSDSTQVGIKTLLGRGVIVTRMNLDDWIYLLDNTALSPSCSEMFSSAWGWRSRGMLDEEIDDFLFTIRQEIERGMIYPFYRPSKRTKFVSAQQ